MFVGFFVALTTKEIRKKNYLATGFPHFFRKTTKIIILQAADYIRIYDITVNLSVNLLAYAAASK